MQQGVIVGLFLYLVGAVVVALLVLMPTARQAAWRRFASAGSRALAWQVHGANQALGSLHPLFGLLKLGARWVRSHALGIFVGLLVLAGVPTLLLGLRVLTPVDTFDHRMERARDPRIAALLVGEQLVPPPALPPELFMYREIEQARPLVRSANREWALLDTDFRQRLLVVFQVLKERHGYEAVLIEGYRSPERQAALKALGPHVTQAGAFESYHQHGLAADIAFLRDGRIVISEQDPFAMQGYTLLGEAATAVGLTWGGGWRSLKDYGHVELRRPGALRRPPDAAQTSH